MVRFSKRAILKRGTMGATPFSTEKSTRVGPATYHESGSVRSYTDISCTPGGTPSNAASPLPSV